MPIYSFGAESPLKIELSEEDAAAYNRFMTAFFDAQKEHLARTGTAWTGAEQLFLKASDEDITTYNRVGAQLTEIIQNFGRPVSADELHDDYLVKN